VVDDKSQSSVPAKTASLFSRRPVGDVIVDGHARQMRRHIPALDGVRGLAVLLVISNHLGSALIPPYANLIDYGAGKVSGYTWVGVDLFFVLSGYLITGILSDTRHSEHYFRNFYARRALRIFPLYYAFLLAVFVLLPRMGLVLPEPDVMHHQAWFWTYVSNFYFARLGWLPMSTGHLWSLSIEEQFYLLWPFVVLLVRRQTLAYTCAILIGVIAVGRAVLIQLGLSVLQVYLLTPTHLDPLLAGAFVALAVRSPRSIEAMMPYARKAFIVAGILILAAPGYKPLLAISHGLSPDALNAGNLPFDIQIQALRYTLDSFFFAALLVLTLSGGESGVWDRLFGSRILRVFGRFSYAIYLIHVPLHALAETYGLPQRLPLIAGMQLPSALFYYVALTATSTLLAICTWHGLEKHFLKLKDYFPYGPRRRRADDLETAREVFSGP
jgi:peptidoglycan/LPS O-acetylase OafA/YrhL